MFDDRTAMPTKTGGADFSIKRDALGGLDAGKKFLGGMSDEKVGGGKSLLAEKSAWLEKKRQLSLAGLFGKKKMREVAFGGPAGFPRPVTGQVSQRSPKTPVKQGKLSEAPRSKKNCRTLSYKMHRGGQSQSGAPTKLPKLTGRRGLPPAPAPATAGAQA